MAKKEMHDFDTLGEFDAKSFLEKQMDDPVGLNKYYTNDEMKEIHPYELLRLNNLLKNYEVLTHLGMKPPKPEFMLTTREKKTMTQRRDREIEEEQKKEELSSDEEWMPRQRLRGSTSIQKIKPVFHKRASVKPRKQKSCTVTSAVPTPQSAEVGERRYPSRSTAKPCNYMLLEVPEDDRFLYCEECNYEYAGDCPVHGPLIVVADSEVNADNNQVRAMQTLPESLYVKQSSIPNAGLGVFTRVAIECRTSFGPYQGDHIGQYGDGHSSGYSWKIHDEQKRSHFVDAVNESTSNWMRYVNCARTEDEQNLHAFQHCGQIHYRTYKAIAPVRELLVFYGADYAKDLGINKMLTHIGRVFSCDLCKLAFSEAKYLFLHKKRKHKVHYDIKGPCCRSTEASVNAQGQGHKCCQSRLQGHVGSHNSERLYKCKQCGYNAKQGRKLLKHTWTQTCGERPYKCTQCGYSATRNDSLQKHIRTHTGERPYKCTQCGYRTTQNGALQSHMRTHTGERPYKCTQCGYSATTNGALQSHMRTHTGERPYKCTQCGYSATQNGDLQRHMRTHTGERPYKCTQCGYSATQNGDLQRLMRTHTGERPYKCTQCGYSATLNGALQSHMRTHTGERPYKCTQCGYRTTQNGALQSHMRTHTGERPYKCTQCGYSATTNGDLQRHMRTHTGERPYKCTQCGYSATQNGHLQRHMRTHTGERPYKCTQCGYSATQNGDLQRHMRTHTGERPYKCTQCGYSATLNGALQSHMRTHTGERPYKCTQCGYSATQNGALQRHMRTHTGGERP